MQTNKIANGLLPDVGRRIPCGIFQCPKFVRYSMYTRGYSCVYGHRKEKVFPAPSFPKPTDVHQRYTCIQISSKSDKKCGKYTRKILRSQV